jgi:hypothetical protein
MVKHALRCHGFGDMNESSVSTFIQREAPIREAKDQNRASPQGVAVTIAASFVARLANIDILAAPRFALSTILIHNAHAFHHATGSQ